MGWTREGPEEEGTEGAADRWVQSLTDVAAKEGRVTQDDSGSLVWETGRREHYSGDRELRLGSLEEREDFSFVHEEFTGPVVTNRGGVGRGRGLQWTCGLCILHWAHGHRAGN